MRPFFSQSPHITEIKFVDGALDSDAVDVITEAVKERGDYVKTIRSFSYSRATVSHSHIAAFVKLAKACTHMTSLTLSRLVGFDLRSCQVIASFLASKNCMLRDLYLYRNRINDDGCRVIAESLRTNRRLRRLGMESNDEITVQGFASFVPVVCDASSIESTLNSNHVLTSVSCRANLVPAELIELLNTNYNADERTVAKLKVLRCHFSDDFDLTAVAGLDAKALPYLLAWFDRLHNDDATSCADSKEEEEQTCRSAFYRIVRHNPELCGYPSYERTMRLRAEDQVAKAATRIEKLQHEANELAEAKSRIRELENEVNEAKSRNEALECELEEVRSNKRQKGATLL